MLNPVHLLTLRAVLAQGSFAGAATELGYTTPAVSQQMAALERATGLTLFERLPRGIRATSSARYLAENGSQIVTALQALERDVKAVAAGRRGEIKVAGFPTASQRLLPTALADFTTRVPEAVVKLDEGSPEELLPALGDGPLDLAIIYQNELGDPEPAPFLHKVHLLTERRHLLLPPSHLLVGRPEVDLRELADETWIASKNSPNLHRLCSSVGFEPRIVFRTDNFEAMRAFVRHGLGIALVPELGYRRDAGVHTVPLSPAPPYRRVYAVHRRLNDNPLLGEMLASLRASVRMFQQESDV